MTLRFSQLSAAQALRHVIRLKVVPNAARGFAAAGLSVAMLASPFAMRAQTQSPAGQATVQSLSPAPIIPGATVVEDVIARVNDQIISRSDLERAQQEMDQEGRQQNIPPAEIAVHQKDLLRDLIDKQLLLSKGKELGITGDTELVKRLDDIRKQNKFDTMEDLEKAASQQGVSFEDFKANIRDGIISQDVVRDEVGRRLQLSREDVQKYYDAHKNEFAQPESVHLSEILIPTPAAPGGTPDDATVAKALATANTVEAKLKNGAKFSEMATQFSGGATAPQGGDLGDYKRGALAKELEDKTFPLPVGQYTDSIRTRQGYVILKVDGHTQAGIPPLADVQQQVEETIYTQQMQPALRAYLTHLREDAYIDIMPGFVDSGASANETKPVYSAYVPPAAKKKKVTEKQRFDRRGRASTASSALPSAPGIVGAGSSAGASAVGALAGAAATASGTAAVNAAAAPPPLNGTATGSSAVPAPAAGSSGLPAALTASSKSNSRKRVKGTKIKREKVRFGQAPREALPEASASASNATTATGSESSGAAAGSAMTAANLGTTTMATAAAEAAPQSPLADPNADLLAPKAEEVKKGRYSARAKLAKKPKPAKGAAAVDPLAPPPATTQELETQKAQAAPLGLGGNTAAKPKKKKRQKGEKKERMQGKQKQAAPVQQPSSAPSPLAAPGPDGVPSYGIAPNGSGEPLQGTPAAGASSVPPTSSTSPLTQPSNPSPGPPPNPPPPRD